MRAGVVGRGTGEPRLDAALERYTRARARHLLQPAARIPPLRRLMLETPAGRVFSG